MAVVWMEPATPFGGHVRKAKRSVSISPPFSSQTDLQFGVQIPANTAGGRVSSNANQVSPRFLPSSPALLSNSLNEVNGTTHRLSMPSHRRQCKELALHTLVTLGSVFFPSKNLNGVGMPHRTNASSRPSAVLRIIGAA